MVHALNEGPADMREEHDLLGTKKIAANLRYGIQTVRAVENFPLSDVSISHFPTFIRALGIVKKAAAIGNHAVGGLNDKKFEAIAKACDDVISGDLNDDFVVDVYQGGAGTSTNMNANEVIANRALEHLGLSYGTYVEIHPNDDVNRSQSTNDVYPTAVRLAIILSSQKLIEGLEILILAFKRKSIEFQHYVKLGRTQLQDAVPITLGQEFRAFASTCEEDLLRVAEGLKLFTEVNLGGTAVGTAINAPKLYVERAFEAMHEISGVPLVQSTDLIEASWDTGAFVSYSGILKRIAVKLSKISNDLRLMSSGPRGGLGEIRLPPRQPGSSIMPGKVNPVIPESVNQVCFQVIGNDLAVTMASEAGQFQLNAFEPVIAFNILTSIRLLSRAAVSLAEKCIDGIEANVEHCRTMAENCTTLATALVPIVGYEAAIRIAQTALLSGGSVKDIAVAEGLDPISTAQLLDPIRMTVAESI